MYETIYVVKIGKIENILVVSSKFMKKFLLKTNSNYDFVISFLEINNYDLYESIGNLFIYKINKNVKYNCHNKYLYYMEDNNESLFMKIKNISNRFPKRIVCYLPRILQIVISNFFINKILNEIVDVKLDYKCIKHKTQYLRL